MANILDILTRAQALRQETALNSITPDRAGGIMYDTLILINQMQLEGGSLLISKVYSSVAAMEADTTPTSDLTGRALRPGQLAVIVPSSSSSSDMGSVYRYNEPGSWTLCGKIGGLPLDTAPIQGSSNGITSGAVYTALSALRNEGYKYMGIATPGSGGTAPGTPNQPVFYIAGPGSYPNFGSITVASGYLGFIKYSGGSWSVESVAVGKDYDEQISQLEAEMDVIDEKTQYLNAEEEDALFISDSNNNIIARIDKDGIKTTAVKTKQTDPSFYKGKIFIADANGNVIFCVDADGIKTTKIHADNVLINDWLGKKVATYGDSVTAVNNGNFQPPYPITQNNWGNRVADYYKFGKQYGRGIGSTCFMWRGTSGGQVAWCKTATGEYVDRNDSYNYDNYEGNVTIPSGCTAVRGDGCSWLRIVTMFPASIKSTIDAVLVMFHNDYHQDMDTAVEWVENSQTDPEWAASDEYETLGGDYNIGTVQGGIASVVMKLQAWMPQARIILMTPISGVYATDDGLDGNFDNTQSALMRKLASVVADIASRMSVPLIDNYGRDGINSLNRTSYIYDKIHPYTANGSKALAASVIGQMKTILPAL